MVTHTVGLEDLIARELSVVPETEQVLVSREGDSVLVWSVVNNVSDEVRCRIYEREMAIMSQFPDLPFDFQVIDRCGRPMGELISGIKPAFQRA